MLDGGVGEEHAWFSTVLPREEYRRGLDLQVAALRKWNPSSARLQELNRTAEQQYGMRQAPPEREYSRQLFDLAFRRGRGIGWEERCARQPSLGRCLSNRELSGSLVRSRERLPGDHRRF